MHGSNPFYLPPSVRSVSVATVGPVRGPFRFLYCKGPDPDDRRGKTEAVKHVFLTNLTGYQVLHGRQEFKARVERSSRPPRPPESMALGNHAHYRLLLIFGGRGEGGGGVDPVQSVLFAAFGPVRSVSVATVGPVRFGFYIVKARARTTAAARRKR